MRIRFSQSFPAILLLILAIPVAGKINSTTCPYDFSGASRLIPTFCHANQTANSSSPSTSNCCSFVFATYIFAAASYANSSNIAFLPELTAAACTDTFIDHLYRSHLVDPSLLLFGDRCNLQNSTQFAAGKRSCQFVTVSDIRSTVNLTTGDGTCLRRSLMSPQSLCTECQNSVETATLKLLDITKSKEFVPCGMATTIGIWSQAPEIDWFSDYVICMVQVLDNIGNLGTSSLIPSPPPPPPTAANSSPVTHSGRNHKKLKLIAGISAAGALAVLASCLLVILFFTRRNSYKMSAVTSFSGSGKNTAGFSLPTEGLYIFTKSELKQATNRFDPGLILGEGGAGKVYLGKLPSGQSVAVKRVYQKKKLDQFYREIEILAKLRHRNLTSLLGYCLQKTHHVLVYEFMSGGNLSQVLYHGELIWNRRVQIAVDCAEGLVYLHEFPEGAVIHRDIKPTNILLTDSGLAKLSDFGVSKFLSAELGYVSTEIKGTTGYLDPEYFSGGQVSESADVYSFGIVLLELITGQRAVMPTPTGGAESIVYRAHDVMMSGEGEPDVRRIADPRLGSGFDVGSMVQVLKIAYRCVKPYKNERPKMKEVLAVLKRVLSEVSPALVCQADTAVVCDEISVSSTSRGSTPSVQPWSL